MYGYRLVGLEADDVTIERSVKLYVVIGFGNINKRKKNLFTFHMLTSLI